MKLVSILGITSLAIAAPLAAQDPVTTVAVQFAKGTSAKTIKGSVKGYATVNYTIAARAGQVMTVAMTTSNKSSYFNITAPGAEEALFNGSINGNRFSGKIPAPSGVSAKDR